VTKTPAHNIIIFISVIILNIIPGNIMRCSTMNGGKMLKNNTILKSFLVFSKALRKTKINVSHWCYGYVKFITFHAIFLIPRLGKLLSIMIDGHVNSIKF
jgi:hypothetical protein